MCPSIITYRNSDFLQNPILKEKRKSYIKLIKKTRIALFIEMELSKNQRNAIKS